MRRGRLDARARAGRRRGGSRSRSSAGPAGAVPPRGRRSPRLRAPSSLSTPTTRRTRSESASRRRALSAPTIGYPRKMSSKPSSREDLGLRRLREGEAPRARGELHPPDLRRLVRLGVRPQVHARVRRAPLHRRDVALEDVEVDQHRRRREIFDRGHAWSPRNGRQRFAGPGLGRQGAEEWMRASCPALCNRRPIRSLTSNSSCSSSRPPAKRRPPFGLRRRGAVCVVIAPRRCSGIAVVALPCI